jgi:hypothetical protein
MIICVFGVVLSFLTHMHCRYNLIAKGGAAVASIFDRDDEALFFSKDYFLDLCPPGDREDEAKALNGGMKGVHKVRRCIHAPIPLPT